MPFLFVVWVKTSCGRKKNTWEERKIMSKYWPLFSACYTQGQRIHSAWTNYLLLTTHDLLSSPNKRLRFSLNNKTFLLWKDLLFVQIKSIHKEHTCWAWRDVIIMLAACLLGPRDSWQQKCTFSKIWVNLASIFTSEEPYKGFKIVPIVKLSCFHELKDIRLERT